MCDIFLKLFMLRKANTKEKYFSLCSYSHCCVLFCKDSLHLIETYIYIIWRCVCVKYFRGTRKTLTGKKIEVLSYCLYFVVCNVTCILGNPFFSFFPFEFFFSFFFSKTDFHSKTDLHLGKRSTILISVTKLKCCMHDF
jgi:hypothetical protein